MPLCRHSVMFEVRGGINPVFSTYLRTLVPAYLHSYLSSYLRTLNREIATVSLELREDIRLCLYHNFVPPYPRTFVTLIGRSPQFLRNFANTSGSVCIVPPYPRTLVPLMGRSPQFLRNFAKNISEFHSSFAIHHLSLIIKN